MGILQRLQEELGAVDYLNLTTRQKQKLSAGLKSVDRSEITSQAEAETFLLLLRKLREAIAEDDRLKGANFPDLLRSLLSVGEDGLYSNNLRFVFELIQNVDDLDFENPEDCHLEMRYDFEANTITLTYNETGFTPFNVFAITGTAEAAKNLDDTRVQIGEKGIGFKSVFGVAEKVRIRSGWFSFYLHKDSYSVPVIEEGKHGFRPGTEMTLYIDPHAARGGARGIYSEIKGRFCNREALLRNNPILFLNKLTSLKLYYDSFRSLYFSVSSKPVIPGAGAFGTSQVTVSAKLLDWDNCVEVKESHSVDCTRYVSTVRFSARACRERYGAKTAVGQKNGKAMTLQVVLPNVEELAHVGNTGALYSFLPTQMKLTVPMVCHAPFKLGASREFVDSQGENAWFQETSQALSELLNQVYLDWSKRVGNEIVRYLPDASKSLFAKQNGEEQNLVKQSVFMGESFLKLPLFQTVDGNYLPANQVYCIDHQGEVADPLAVHAILKNPKELFLPPKHFSVQKLRITRETEVNHKIFKKVFSDASVTDQALHYLESVGYQFQTEQLESILPVQMCEEQARAILTCRAASEWLQKQCSDRVKQGKKPDIQMMTEHLTPISQALYEGFSSSDSPKQVEQYLNQCGNQCVLLEMDEKRFLPCRNALILSSRNPELSFAEFCSFIDKNDLFSIRMQLRRASDLLNQIMEDESTSAREYLRNLRNSRQTNRDSLGAAGYRRYLHLILDSGTDRNRFIQELLQNADDCVYPEEVVPTFILKQSGNTITTEYNERGFSRANIRAITAIGESTKDDLLKQNDTIGKKGVGFKTIFAIASEVQIHSGDYHFRLKDHSPTIPDLLRGYEGKRENGTKMVITTKGERGGAVLDRSSMLQMCLCLRRLRRISIDSHEMTITDTETERKIKLDGTEYRFRRYELPFTANQEALQEIRERTNHVSEQQRITCYVPIDKKESEYPLYVGLPTTHRIRIPVVIDAPFELTTSREQINTDFRRWNVLVRRKVYEAVLQMMLHRRNEDGERIFRFVRILARREGTAQVYKNVFSDCEFLNQHPILSDLKQAEILPTFAAGTYARPDGRSALVYPPVANYLFQEGSFGSVMPQQAIRVVSKDYVSVLNALMCRNAAPKKVLPLLERYSRTWIAQEEYRSLLYEYLQGISQEFQARLQKMPIIPVYGRSEGKTVFISWERNTIFVKKNAKISNADYFVLNESFLPKASCERFLGVNINEVTRDWERSRYNDNLVELLRGRDVERIYEALLREYQSGRLEQNGSWGVLLEHRERVPLKNLMDDIVDTDLFWSNMKEDYFQVEMLLSLIVHPECRELAQKLRYEELKYIRYENLEIDEALTEDDVEALTDSYFQYSDELLHGCYRDGYLSRDLLEEHNLQYIGVTVSEGEMEHYTFPGEPVLNPKRLKIFIENQMRDRGKIVSVKCTRMVQKIQNKNGKTYDIPERETRDKTMERYEPEGRRDLCFCQMCKKVKSKAKIEVNRLEPEPLLYFHQMHVALCLECSVDFKAFRQNPEIEQRFLSTIRRESTANRPMIAVQLYKDRTITFTGTHLAEIQEILRQRPRR